MGRKRQGPARRTHDPAPRDTMPLRETHFADEVTRHSYQLALKEMDTRIGDAGLTATVILQTSGEFKIDAAESGPEGVGKVRQAAKRAGANHAMAADWLRQLARITRGVKRGATIYSGTSLTVATSPGHNTDPQREARQQSGAEGPQDGKHGGSREKRASSTAARHRPTA